MERPPDPPQRGAPSKVAVVGHPLHPALVTFPIAFFLGAAGTDLVFLIDPDPFWARMSLWLLGAGSFMGTVAGLSGAVELLAVRRIRRRPEAWHHFVAAVMLLGTGFANWSMRVADPVEAFWPWGLYLSLLGAALVVFSGWLGGALVFRYQLGVEDDDED